MELIVQAGMIKRGTFKNETTLFRGMVEKSGMVDRTEGGRG